MPATAGLWRARRSSAPTRSRSATSGTRSRTLNSYEGRPEARPFTREELQRFLDYADDQVERAVRAKRKGALAAYRDATLFKVVYGWGCSPGVSPRAPARFSEFAQLRS